MALFLSPFEALAFMSGPRKRVRKTIGKVLIVRFPSTSSSFALWIFGPKGSSSSALLINTDTSEALVISAIFFCSSSYSYHLSDPLKSKVMGTTSRSLCKDLSLVISACTFNSSSFWSMRTILNPFSLNYLTNSFPISFVDPDTTTQVPFPYLWLKFCFSRMFYVKAG